MFECSCTYVADRHPQWARRVQAGHPRYAASYDMLVQAVHDWALCPPAYRAAHYEFVVSCLAQALYGAPSLLTPAYARGLKAHGPKCRRLSRGSGATLSCSPFRRRTVVRLTRRRRRVPRRRGPRTFTHTDPRTD